MGRPFDWNAPWKNLVAPKRKYGVVGHGVRRAKRSARGRAAEFGPSGCETHTHHDRARLAVAPTSPALATFGGHLRYCAMASHFPEEIVRTRMAVDQARLSRLATQNAIERSRQSLAETRALLVALRYALGTRTVRRFASSKRRERG